MKQARRKRSKASGRGRVAYQRALRESEERYRSLFQSMSEGFAHCKMVFDDNGGPVDFVYLDVNSAFGPLTGLKNVVGKRVTEVIPGIKDDHPELFEIYGRVASTGRPEKFEIDLKPLDISLSISVSSPTKGDFIAVFENITEQKRAGERLRQSEERYRSLFDRMQDGIYLSTHDGRFVDVNSAFVKMFGYTSKQEMLNIVDIKKELYFSAEERGRHILDTGREEVVVYRMRRKDGSEIWVEDHGRYVHDEQGKITLHEGLLRDVTERVRAETALSESEEKYRAIVENSPNIIMVLQEGVLKYVNRAACESLGWTFEEMTSSSFNVVDKVVPEKFRAMVEEKISKRLGGERVPPYEVPVIKRDGAEIPVIVRAERIMYLGKPADAITLIDIGDRKRMEEALRRRAEELDSLQESLLQITGRHDLPKLLESIVERAAGLLGAPSGGMYLCDIEKKEVRCVVGYNTKTNPVGNVLKYGEGAAGIVAQTGKPLSVDDYRTWSGRAAVYEKDQPFRAVLNAPMVWQGQTIGVIDVLEDSETRRFTESDLKLLELFANHAAIAIQNQRHAENLEQLVEERTRELRAATERLEYVVALNPATIYSGRPLPDYSDWHLTYISDRVTTMLGFEPQRFIGHPEFWEGHVHPDDLRTLRVTMPLLFKKGYFTFDYRFRHKDGTYRWVREEATLVRGADGKPVEVNGYWTDITELRRMQELVAESERMAAVGQTAAMMAHDLRNPLQAISAATYVLEKTSAPTTDEKTREMLEAIQKSVAYSAKIVNDLLEYSQDVMLEVSETTPRVLAQDALLQVNVPANITVSDLTSDGTRLRVDAPKVRRIFVNLIQNALDSMPQGGQLTISSDLSNNYLEIKFTDTGVGIPENVLRQLWKPLITTKPKGVGLGLALCKRMVDAHGGPISVDSKVEKGTTFTVRFPITRQEGAARA